MPIRREDGSAVVPPRKKPKRRPTPPTPAPISDVQAGGDKTPGRSGHSRPRPSRPSRSSGSNSVGQAISEVARREERRQRRRERRARRVQARLRGSKAAKPEGNLTAEDRRNLLLDAALKEHKRDRERFLRTAGMTGDIGDLAEKLAAPAIRALDESTRPAEFIAGAVNRQIENVKEGDIADVFNPVENVKAGWESGGSRKNRKTGADVLKTAGAKGALKDLGLSDKQANVAVETAGLVGDVVTDPLTYLSGGVAGTGRVAVRAAQKAGRREFNRAVAEGATRKEAKRRASRAARRAHTKAPKNRGLTIGVGSKRTSGRTTAAVSRAVGIPNVARHVSTSRTAEAARKVFPIRPREIPEEEWSALKAADRERRGTVMHETRRTARRGRAIRKGAGGAQRRILPEREMAGGKLRLLPRRRRVPVEASAKIRDAIETQDFSGLTESQRAAARAIEAEQERLFQLRRDAGENPARYTPRTAQDQAEQHITRKESIAELEALAQAYERNAKRQRDTGKFAFGKANEVHMDRAARKIRAEIVRLSRGGRSADASAPEPEGYMFRQAMSEVTDKRTLRRVKRTGQPIRQTLDEPTKGTGSRRRTTTLEDFARGDRRPMAEVRETEAAKYIEDVETTLLSKAQKDVGRAASSRYRGRVLDTGRPLKKDTKWNPDTEGIYTVRDGKLVDVSKGDRWAGKGKRMIDSDGEDLVILKKAVADHANNTMREIGAIPFLDKPTNAIKWALTIPNPQYWARNAYGGTFNAWSSGVPGRAVVRDTFKTARVNRAIRKEQRADEQLGAVARQVRPVKVLPGGKTMPMDEFIAELERVNISGGGQTTELLGANVARRGKAQALEDFPRILSYIHYRRAGNPPEEAARLSLKSQFDYGDLTAAERDVFRRVFPFYTWRSRNIALQAQNLVLRPGKVANTEKVRDTAAALAGLPEDWQEKLTEAEQLGVPVPLMFETELPNGDKVPILLFPALPITDLNLFTPNVAALAQQIGGSVHPIKGIAEFLTNYSLFFRGDIETEGSRWTAAPDILIKRLPKGVREKLKAEGLIRWGKDRWTGKWTWQWRGKTSYLSKLTPFSSTALMAGTSSRNRVGQNSEMAVAGWLTGLRPRPYAADNNKLAELYDERQKVQTQIADTQELRTHKRKGWDPKKHSGEGGWDTPAYDRLQEQEERINRRIFELEGDLGKKDRTEPAGVAAGETKTRYEEWKESQGSAADRYKDWKESRGSTRDRYEDWKAGK